MSSPVIPQIVATDSPRQFTLAEAQSLLPIVRRISERANEELDPIRKRLEGMLPTDPRAARTEERYEAVVRRWAAKMERLGLVVKGLWLVDFDTGDGYICWRWPERQLAWYHGYESGFAGRRPLREVIEELDPDWA
jgi:hypothetical protein